ncbi:MAG TPA: hypothetical protein PKA00_21375 [Saprospiraceae bacterium]|nr:hypothetical protein [Saprospiraceae bacterium]HMQ85476.1 hypothetical protein [Saprospiraceae bacterium]
MKSLAIFFFLFSTTTALWAQTTNPRLDTALATQLGADEYGMKMYVFVILKSGNNPTTDRSFIDSCFTGHLANIRRLAASNQLIVAGPFGENDSDFRGLFILNVPTPEEAEQLLETDPAIKAALLKAELYPWYGSAALPAYLEVHDKIWKSNP